MGHIPQFNEVRLLCGVPANGKIDSSALPPIDTNNLRIIVIALKVFAFCIITDANYIFNKCKPITSKLVIT